MLLRLQNKQHDVNTVTSETEVRVHFKPGNNLLHWMIPLMHSGH